MGSNRVFPAEMPDEPTPPTVPLDADTAERLLSGRLDPDDAPPGYAEVTRLLRTAAAPADATELAGEAVALDAFRRAQRPQQRVGRPGQALGRAAEAAGRRGEAQGRRGEALGRREASGRRRGPSGRPPRSSSRHGRTRGRLAALALAGVVAAAGVGVWTAGGAPSPGELGSPSGGPSAGGPGSGSPASGTHGSAVYGSAVYGSGAYGSESGEAGALRPAWRGVGSATGTTSVGGGVTSRGGGSPHGTKPTWPPKQPKPKPEKPKPPKPQPKNKVPKDSAPKAQNPSKPKAPKAAGGQG